MNPEEFHNRIKEIHEQLNDAFIAVSAMPVDYRFIGQKTAAKDCIIGARRSLDAAGLTHFACLEGEAP